MTYPEIDIQLDIRSDLVEYIWKKIDALISLGFKFPEFRDWQANQISRVEKGGLHRSDSQWLSMYREAQVYSYFNMREKVPKAKKRKIIFSSQFECPKEYTEGLKKLSAAIEDGRSLWPYVSRKIIQPNSQDGLLFDFGIFHLHLGTESDPKRPFLIQGTKDLLYCMFDEETAYFLRIGDHSLWLDFSLLEVVQSEFEHLISKWEYRISSTSKMKLATEQRNILRKNNLNALIEIGDKSYFQPGGGVMGSGVSSFSVIKADDMFYHYEGVQEGIILMLKADSQKIQAENQRIIPKIHLRLVDPDEYIFIDESLSLKIKAYVNPKTLVLESLQSI
jgi:hypothetical protein